MQGNLRYYSEVKSRSGSREHEFFDFLDREGPTGGRLVIDGIWFYANWDIDVATAAVEGEDFAKVFGRIIVEDRTGRKRWNLTGAQTRIMSYLLCGAERYSENADTSASEDDLTGTTAIYVPMTKPMVHTPDDFALPVDDFAKAIVADCGDAALDIGTADATINSIDYYLIVDAHEDHDLQLYCVDVVKADKLTTNTEAVVSVNGKLHELVLWADGAAGGASLSNFTDIRIDEPLGLLKTAKRTELLREYRWRRGVANNLNSTVGGELRSDPFAAGKASAIIFSDHRTSAWSGPFIERLKLNLTNSVDDVYALTRTIKPRSADMANATASAYGLRDAAQLSVKTDKKTARSIGQWPKHIRPYLRLKAPLAKAA